jgi:hypothetical protein
MDKDDKVKASALNCLQQYKDELRSDKCKAQIHRMTQRASRDIRFDEMLASACTEDRNKYCQDIQPGSARVIRCLQVGSTGQCSCCCCCCCCCCCRSLASTASHCWHLLDAEHATCLWQSHWSQCRRRQCNQQQLKHRTTQHRTTHPTVQEHRNSLQQKCAAAMFDHEVRMAEDIDFKYPMKRSCAWEISSFCKNLPHGHARIIRCLEQQLEHPGAQWRHPIPWTPAL